MMTESTPLISHSEVTPDEQMEIEFTNFIDGHNFTATQIQEAYYRLMGETVNADMEVPEELLGEMRRMEHTHFPLNRFAQFVETLVIVERAVPIYEQFVDSLPVTENEKWMLNSLVRKNRIGELKIFFGPSLEAKLLLKEAEVDQRGFAMAMLDILKKYAAHAQSSGQKIGFVFTEQT